MIKVNLKSVSAPVSVFEAVKAENPDVLKGILCAEVNGKVVGLSEEISENGEITLFDFSDPEGKKTYWHTTSHVLAEAVKILYPDAKLAIGPATDNGFYYDFDYDPGFTNEDLAKIESQMKKIIKKNTRLNRYTL